MDDVEAVLPVLPSSAAVLVLVLTVGLLVAPPSRLPVADRSPRSWTASALVGAFGLTVLALLAVAARFGAESEVANPVPALVIGLGPLLLLTLPLLAALVPRGGPAEPPAAGPDPAPSSVWPALPAVLAVAAYLAVVPGRGDPQRLAAALASYAVLALAVAVALGRATASRAEPLGLLASWVGLGPRLVRWSPPRGAAAVVAVVLAGAWCERWARSESWRSGIPGLLELWGLLGTCLLGAVALAALLHRWSGSVAAAALVPLAVGAVVAGGLRRAVISAQLLLQQAGSLERVEPDPLGIAGGQLAALGIVAVAGCLAAVVVARRSGAGPARLPALSLVLAATAVSSVVVLQP